MSKDRRPLPPGDYTIKQIKAIRPLMKFIGLFNRGLRQQFRQVERQLDSVQQMMANRDLFAKAYSPLGWVAYDRLSTEIVATALAMNVGDGEDVLTKYHLDQDNLRQLGHRFYHPQFEAWRALYECAIERVDAEDYLSAIPLVLSIIDGICVTSTNKHPFSGGADAPVFDSLTSGPGGLSEGLALLGSTRRKLNVEPISMPFRHGIVHGLTPNYGNPLVAAKVLNLLQATVDYFDRRRDEAQRVANAAEEQKAVDIRQLAESLQKNKETKKALDDWQARPAVSDIELASSGATVTLSSGSPELAATEYLSLLVARNFGSLARRTVDYPRRPLNQRAGQLRNDLEQLMVMRWKIIGVEDVSAAISVVTTRLEGELDGSSWTGEHKLRMMFADDEYASLVRGQAGGVWAAMPDFLSDLRLVAMRSLQEL